MSFTIQPGTIADLPTMSQVMLNAVAADIWWTTMKGTMSPEEEYKFTLARLEASLGAGIEAGVSEVWKVVDENGFVSLIPKRSSKLKISKENSSMGRPRAASHSF